MEALAVTRPPALGITGEAVGTSRLITAKKCSHDRAKNHPGKKIVFGSLKSARAPVFAGLRRVRWCSKAPYQSTVILGKGRKAISICWLPKHPANVLVTKLVANSGPRVGIEWDGSARAADFRNTNQHFEGQNETGRNGRQQISSGRDRPLCHLSVVARANKPGRWAAMYPTPLDETRAGRQSRSTS